MTDRYVATLAQLRQHDVAAAGGKGANLGELMGAGFGVPDGFVVTTHAYLEAVRDSGLATVIAEQLRSGDPDGSALRAAIETAQWPEPLSAAVTSAYAVLGGGPVAVRSSATAEDLAGAAFAGQQDTFLAVDGEVAVLDAVRRCWASLWTDRAIAYRRRILGHRDGEAEGDGGPEGESEAWDGVAMAVVVQRMVDADVAGVLFTADPVTGERDVTVVDVARGLGEALVSGTVTPDHIELDAQGVVRKRSGELLDHVVLAELAATGRAVERHFGRPQDVEWARAADRTWIVQARPMTALPPPPLRLSALQRAIGRQLLDYVTARPYPLDLTAWTLPAIGRLVERMLREIPGLYVDLADLFPETDGVVERFVPPSPRPTRAVLTLPFRLVPRLRRYQPLTWTADPRLARFRTAVRELAEHDPASLEWAELMAVPRRAHAVTDLISDLRVDYLPRVGFDLVRLAGLLALLRRTALLPLLVLGARTRTDDANQALQQLADQVRADPALHAVVTGLEPAALVARIESDAAFAGFRAAVRSFRAEYGHRETASLMLMSQPTSGEDPAAVLGMIRMFVDEPHSPKGADADGAADASTPQADRAAQAEELLLSHPLVRLTRSVDGVRRRLDAVRAGIAFREDTHFYVTAALPALRAALLEAGARLVAAGVLARRGDVLHLRLAEIEAIADPHRLTADDAERLAATVRRRAARREELAGSPLIATASLFPVPDAASDVLAQGVAASAGRATGVVRLVTGPAEFGTVRSGEVLVCPYTNPTWTPLFQRAAAVVVDSGGMASHAAIVAREYGIPAVMGTGSGTSLLAPGRLVTVDGTLGRVTAA